MSCRHPERAWRAGGFRLALLGLLLGVTGSAVPRLTFAQDSLAVGTSVDGAPAAPGAPVVADAGDSLPPAPLVFQNRRIAVFRAKFVGYTPQERVDSALNRIHQFLESEVRGAITSEPIPQGLQILAGGKLVFVLLPEDLDALSGETLEAEGREAVQALTAAIGAWREQRSVGSLIGGAIRVAVATVVFLIFLRLLGYLDRRVKKLMGAVTSRHLGTVERAGFARIDRVRILKVTERSVSLLIWGVRLVAMFFLIAFSLSQFPYTAPWGQAMGHVLFGTAGRLALGILHAIPGLLTVVLILVFTRFLVGVVKLVLASVEAGQITLPGIDAEVVAPTKRLVVMGLWLGAVVMAYPYLPGSDSLAFKGVGLLFGLMASLGGSRLVGQAISGFVVMYARALRQGELVRVGEHEGFVSSINLLSVRLRNYKNEEITIPSSLVVDSVTKNYSRLAAKEPVRVSALVTIGYNAPWRQVHAMLIEAAGRTPGLRKEPAPFVLQKALGDFYVEYEVVACIEDPRSRVLVMTSLHQNIQDCFNESGVQIMSPHYEGDPSEKVWVPRERWFEKPAVKPEGERESG